MRFELQGQRVTYVDSQPGEHATLFGPDGERALFDNEHSRFDDSVRQYAWAFNLPTELLEDERVTFATADREVTGVRRAGWIVVVPYPLPVNRVAVGVDAGKPLALSRRP